MAIKMTVESVGAAGSAEEVAEVQQSFVAVEGPRTDETAVDVAMGVIDAGSPVATSDAVEEPTVTEFQEERLSVDAQQEVVVETTPSTDAPSTQVDEVALPELWLPLSLRPFRRVRRFLLVNSKILHLSQVRS